MSSNWQKCKIIRIYVNENENRIPCMLKDF